MSDAPSPASPTPLPAVDAVTAAALPESVPAGEAYAAESGPSAARVRALRWLVRLRAGLLVAALIAIAVYFSSVFGPGARLAFFVLYGVLAAAYVGVYLYVLATRRGAP